MNTISSDLLARAEGILRQCLANHSGDAALEEFSDRIGRDYRFMIPVLLQQWAANVIAAAPDDFPISATLPAGEHQAKIVVEPPSSGETSFLAQPHDGLSPAAPDAPAPLQCVEPIVRLAQEHTPTIHAQRIVPAPKANPPRNSIAAIVGSNRRLAQSILDTWVVNGKKFGDCMVGEVIDACNTRDRSTMLMRAVVKDLPRGHIIRTVLTAEGAQHRLAEAQAALPKALTIEATQPGGYRRVS